MTDKIISAGFGPNRKKKEANRRIDSESPRRCVVRVRRPWSRTRAYLSRVGEEKKKTPLGHRSPASLTGIGVGAT